MRSFELLRDSGNSPFPVRFKWLLNISVAAAGLRLLLCRFCVFPLPAWQFLLAAPAGWGRLSSAGAGAVVSAAGEALLPGRTGGVPGGVAEKQGVSLARGIGLYAPIPSPLSQTSLHWHVSCGELCRCSSWGVAEKGGGGFYVEHYENN